MITADILIKKKKNYLWLILTNLIITIQKYILICCLIQLGFLFGVAVTLFFLFFLGKFFLIFSLFGFYLLFSFSYFYLIHLYLLHFYMSGLFFQFSFFIQHFFLCSFPICFYSFSISFLLPFTFFFCHTNFHYF